jgi:protein involved in polysaccharide export with SLBB domain
MSAVVLPSRVSVMTVLAFLFLANTLFAQPAGTDINDFVHAGDIVDVDFVGSADNDWRGAVSPDGTLGTFVSYAEPITAACRDVDSIASDIAAAFSKILREPKVIVRIVDRSKRPPATVFGAVKTGTRFSVRRPVSLRELIVRVGGFTDDASGEITILRPPGIGCVGGELAGRLDNGPQIQRIKITDLLKGDEKANVRVLSGDTVEVERGAPIYVIGAVNSPRPIFARAELTVGRALSMVGGLSKDAEGSKATIFRHEGSERTAIPVDLGRIREAGSVDVVLKPFDILDVAGKGPEKRNFPPFAPNLDIRDEKKEMPFRIIEPLP